MKLIVCISLFLISASNCFASQTEHQAIKSIINTYQQSTEAKDKARFLTLFVDDSSPVIGVFSDLVDDLFFPLIVSGGRICAQLHVSDLFNIKLTFSYQRYNLSIDFI